MANKIDLQYYDYSRLLSHNAVFNFVVGGRGLGKTYGAKKHVINKYFKNGEQFILLRRYRTELTTRQTFFDDIQHEWPEYMFRVNGVTAQCSHVTSDIDSKKKRTWHTMGYFIALTTAQSMKGVAYPKVTTIIFDEFIIEKGLLRYLPDETTVLHNFYSTVDRYKDKTRVLFLANSVSIMNPYFLEYEIRPDMGKEFITKSKGFICAHFPDSKAFGTGVYQTRFGKFIKGTEYADYAVGNVFEDNHDNLVSRKPATAKYMYTLETKHGVFSVWFDFARTHYYLQEKRPKQEVNYTLLTNSVDENKVLLLPNEGLLQMIRAAYRTGRISFDTPKTRNSFIEVFKH